MNSPFDTRGMDYTRIRLVREDIFYAQRKATRWVQVSKDAYFSQNPYVITQGSQVTLVHEGYDDDIQETHFDAKAFSGMCGVLKCFLNERINLGFSWNGMAVNRHFPHYKRAGSLEEIFDAKELEKAARDNGTREVPHSPIPELSDRTQYLNALNEPQAESYLWNGRRLYWCWRAVAILEKGELQNLSEFVSELRAGRRLTSYTGADGQKHSALHLEPAGAAYVVAVGLALISGKDCAKDSK